jgi:hypothetical protein
VTLRIWPPIVIFALRLFPEPLPWMVALIATVPVPEAGTSDNHPGAPLLFQPQPAFEACSVVMGPLPPFEAMLRLDVVKVKEHCCPNCVRV